MDSVALQSVGMGRLFATYVPAEWGEAAQGGADSGACSHRVGRLLAGEKGAGRNLATVGLLLEEWPWPNMRCLLIAAILLWRRTA